MNPIILFRSEDPWSDDELKIASKYFDVYTQRSKIPPNSLVIGRYSVLPYYRELEEDLKTSGSYLINTHEQYCFIANIQEWADLIKTPQTWYTLDSLPNIPVVIKGQTNSRKDRWNTHMFAKSKKEALNITLLLQEDPLIGSQQIYYRKYISLKTYGNGLNGVPITDEFRFFLLDGTIISGGYYWSSHLDLFKGNIPEYNMEHYRLAHNTANILYKAGKLPRFLVIDVATTATGDVIVIELNDGQMSGLSENDPEMLYCALKDSEY